MTARKPTLEQIRTAVADYIVTEGCGCCSDHKGHEEAAEILGKMLKVQKYRDGSGYDFYRYQTQKERR